MLAFGKPGEIREVNVPEMLGDLTGDDLLEQIYWFGQNDMQPQQHPSVSMGDVIELDSKYYLVMTEGFKELSTEKLAEYMSLEQRDRHFSAFQLRENK
jgi:hypothetical protein